MPTFSRSRAIPVLVIVIAAAAAVWPSWPPLFTTWHVMDSYAHGWLLTLFVIGWIVARGAELPKPDTRLSRAGLVLLLGLLIAWLVAYRASSAIGQQVLIPLILWSAVWAGCGIQTALRIAAPISCLYFAIPIWEFLLPALQHTTVFVAQTGLGVLGVPVHIDGVLVNIPEGTFEIAEGCAGKRYFIVALAIAGLFAGTTRMRPWRAFSFIVMTAVLSLLMNWIRVLTVIYAGHITNMTSYLVAREHISFGWALFALLVVLILALGARFARGAPEPPSDTDWSANPGSIRAYWLRPATGIAILALCLPAAAILYARHADAASDPPSLHMPHTSGDWLGPQPPDELWRPRYTGASQIIRTAYRSPGGDIQLYVAEYGPQRPGSKLISSANTLLSPDWSIARSGALESGNAGQKFSRVGAIWAETAQGQRWLITYDYLVGSIVTSSPIVAQLVYGARSWARPTPSRVVAMAVRCRSNCSAEIPQIRSFWESLGAGLLTLPRIPK